MSTTADDRLSTQMALRFMREDIKHVTAYKALCVCKSKGRFMRPVVKTLSRGAVLSGPGTVRTKRLPLRQYGRYFGEGTLHVHSRAERRRVGKPQSFSLMSMVLGTVEETYESIVPVTVPTDQILAYGTDGEVVTTSYTVSQSNWDALLEKAAHHFRKST